MSDTIEAVAARLASRDPGRTEADIQSDVRKFLLDAPLQLADPDVIDIKLEAQAGEGRRIDVEAGCAAIEVKRSLDSKTIFDRAVEQLAGYVAQRTEERGQRYVGVLTDGQTWVLFHLTPERTLAEVSRLQLGPEGDSSKLTAWLDHVLATTLHIKPTEAEIVRRLGSGSPGFALDLADLTTLYAACRTDPEVRLKRELWARLLVAALGTNFEDSDALFVAHTYLVLTAELLAHAVVGIPLDDPSGDVRELLEGARFDLVGLHGVVEADFFDWPTSDPAGTPIVRGIARRLTQFDWSAVDHDVLKALYESVIDPETRHRLGEYYTPDWLADKIVRQAVSDPLNQRILDPACGSGTFLFWAVRHLIEACEADDLPNREIVRRVTEQVNGIDLHPVAVTLARVTYLLALGAKRLQDRDEITIPVWLGDSVRWEQDESMLANGGITIRTSDKLEFFEQELRFPEAVVEDPVRFDRLVAELAERASNRNAGTKPPGISGLLDRHGVRATTDREAVALVFARLCDLHDHGRNHIWGYYIRNLARPLSFARPDGRVDVLIGNPPWLSYRHMPEALQISFRRLTSERGLWLGGKNATQQDLSDLFVARAIEQYLKLGGHFAFVMPFAVLSRRQYAGFRSADWSSPVLGLNRVTFDEPEGFSLVKPPLFPVPAALISGTRTEQPRPLSQTGVSWSGRVGARHASWNEVEGQLARQQGSVEAVHDDIVGSPYREQFKQGATLVPRVLVAVEQLDAGPLGVAAGRVEVRSARSALEKEPWKKLPSQTGVVERQFVKAMVTGATMFAFREGAPEMVVVPYVHGELVDSSDDVLDEYPGLAGWWRAAESLWEKNKARGSKLSLLDRIDYQRGLCQQLPTGQHRVVYTTSGQYLAACRLEHADAVVDSSLYWASVGSLDEARYLTAILNSTALADAVAPLQARGEHNPRHFHRLPLDVPLPTFDTAIPLHKQLVLLAERAEHIASAVTLDPARRFEVGRRAIREALGEDGVGGDLSIAVRELLF
jgi:N-6 DNA Methylase